MADTISNSDDIIDSRDVIARIEELTEMREALREADEDAGIANAGAGFEDDEELAALEALQEEAEPYAPDWQYGATLIRETYFVDYCEELCKDIGDVPQDLPGYLAIDWGQTAENIKVDYTEVNFDGVPYLVR